MATTSTVTILDLGPQLTTICVTREDTTPMTFHMKDSAGVDISIVGRTYVLTVNSEEEPSNTLNQIFNITGAVATPLVSFTPLPADLDIAPETYFYDIQETNGAAVRTIAKGQFIVGPQITQ